jgi:molecular chaperone DnaJ
MQQGFFSIQQTCPKCHGTGKVIPTHARRGGAGRIKRNKTLEVKIPVGIDNGMRIRSSGNGEPGTNGGRRATCTWKSTSSRTPCSSAKATTCIAKCRFRSPRQHWAEIEVPTLNGVVHDPGRHPVGQDLPPERQGHQGRALRFAGDLFCHVAIETPVKLTEKQKDCCASLKSRRPRAAPSTARRARPGKTR